MNNRRYVGNLSFQTTEVAIRDLFAQSGTVTSDSIVADKFTGKSRGFAFVEMASSEEANQSIAALHGKQVDVRVLTVTSARPREERPRGEFAGVRRNGGDRRSY